MHIVSEILPNFVFVMNRQTIARFILALMVVVAILESCNPEDDRLLSYQHTVQVGFYSAYTKKDTVLVNVRVWGENRPNNEYVQSDTLLYDYNEDKTESINKLFLNLNMNADSTVFFLKSRTLVDRLSFYYTKSLEPVSGAGGITMEMRIDTMYHTQQNIISAEIVHKPIKYNEDRENVKLYIY